MKRRNKILFYSISSLAIVAVATVGFSSWIVGIEQKETTTTIDVEVDNTSNETCYLNVVASSDPVEIGEKEPHDRTGNDIIGASENDENSPISVSETAMQFSFETFELYIGNGIAVSAQKTKVDITLDSSNDAFNTVNSSANLIGRSGSETWTYLAYTASFLLTTEGDNPNFTVEDHTSDGNYKIYKLVEGKMTQSLSWGTFFGKKSPVTYYNEFFQKEENLANRLTATNKICKELDQMAAAVKTNITLSAKVTL